MALKVFVLATLVIALAAFAGPTGRMNPAPGEVDCGVDCSGRMFTPMQSGVLRMFAAEFERRSAGAIRSPSSRNSQRRSRMIPSIPSAEAYTNEPVRYPPLTVIDISEEATAVGEVYRNVVPAGTVRRTRGIGRAVNVWFEELAAGTVFIDHAIEPAHDADDR